MSKSTDSDILTANWCTGRDAGMRNRARLELYAPLHVGDMLGYPTPYQVRLSLSAARGDVLQGGIVVLFDIKGQAFKTPESVAAELLPGLKASKKRQRPS